MRIQKVSDAKIIAKLNEPVQNLHHELYPWKFKEFDYDAVSIYFQNIINDENQNFYVCYIDNEVAGYIWFEEIKKKETAFSNASHYLYIQQISVNENQRGRGVGKHLLNIVLRFANEKSIKRIGLDYWVKNIVAKNVYEQLGFELEKEITYLTL